MASALVLLTTSPSISLNYPPLPRSLTPSPSLFSTNLSTRTLSHTNTSYRFQYQKPFLSFLKASSHGVTAEIFNQENKEVVEEAEQEEQEEKEEEEISRAMLIWRAIKLPIYSVAFIPLTVGSAAAYLQTGLFHTRRYLVLLLSSVLIITWLNLSNDVYDFETGADKEKKESVVKLIGSPAVTLYAANTFLVLGFIGLLWASVEAGDMRSICLLTGAILCGYVYQCPPFRLSYLGLGEPLCLAAFGPFATPAFYLSQSSKSDMCTLPLTSTILSASLLVGMTTSLILFCSHFHQLETAQVDGDRAVGKMSPLVRMGTQKGSVVVKVAIMTIYFLLFAFSLSKALPLTCTFFCALTLPMGKVVADFVEEYHGDKIKIFMAKYYCVRLHSLFGVALAAGLLTARYYQMYILSKGNDY
ncbi:2-carboxy-1,4-naphthoquinone phytyltransferase, chloroplastic isoform X1 [Cinnamomum micranthum f. kanehirae]|uniref:2-carboxy-1,4-naphthoquinone phytyltransferase, chloroplastic isoform X1 n=1 Tax=Cinnamomum micranthum f. kanehirae TaxID=337451 RepID=A0A3S3NAW3_9MAGN|nr:2-carboxy-1,4-naphthoquinone phytyltransferase, chloroplastic isoform X1 [Cinnamomum micranthum f. kanehirae]